MQPWKSIADAIAAATGKPFSIENRSAVGGGCINAAFRLEGSGRAYFVKTNDARCAPFFAAEAAALAEMAAVRAIRVPQPVCHGVAEGTSWLALEYLSLAPEPPAGMRRLGHELARLHRKTAETFGWDRDNSIGATPQINTPSRDWCTFWREQRLGFQLSLAGKNGYGGALQRAGVRLAERLPAFFAGHAPPPALLHGDLWSGNAAFDEAGAPVLFDPALYYGDRETDVAMTALFGGFSPDFYAAYRESYPLDAGYEARRDLYNLYHVLNHLNLFGGSYLRQAEHLIGRLLALA